MSKVDQIAEIAAEGVADGMHVVSEEALAAEKVVRGLDDMRLAYLGLGVAIGAVVGGLVAFKVAYLRAETKYNEIAAEEIAGMRDHYNAKLVARDAESQKKTLAEIVEEQGYGDGDADKYPTEGSPLAVSAPKSVVEAARASAEETTPDPRPAPEPPEEEVVENVFDALESDYEWDEGAERRKRSPLKPYVIHIDERDDNAAYEGVTYTYYEDDDVLTNEREEVMNKEDRERIVGETNLERFGHSMGGPHVVYVRNNPLEMDIEILRSQSSYAQEVHGFEPVPEDEDRPSRRRGRTPDEDD